VTATVIDEENSAAWGRGVGAQRGAGVKEVPAGGQMHPQEREYQATKLRCSICELNILLLYTCIMQMTRTCHF